MPTGRALWMHSPSSSSWLAVSKAVSNPYIVSENVSFPVGATPTGPGGPVIIPSLDGNDDIQPESVVAYELGHRSELSQQLTLDLATFYNDYDNLFSFSACPTCSVDGSRFPAGSIPLPLSFENGQTAESFGVEVALDYRPFSWWRLATSYTYLHINVSEGFSNDPGNVELREDGSPTNQVYLRSQFNISEDWQFDANGRYVDSLAFGSVDSYIDLDLRLAWKIRPNLELSVIGQNLLHDSHLEAVELILAPPPTEIRRAVFGKIVWSF